MKTSEPRNTVVVQSDLPKIYDILSNERKWQKIWEETEVYRFERLDRSRSTYSIDTPPPYPSGEFHMGNALNWCYFDFVARYRRMRGYNVHFPQGWDCHGLPTEVRAEITFRVKKRDLPVNEFTQLCTKLTLDYIERMKSAMKSMGYSIDWSLEYRTMDPSYFQLTQLSFILLNKKGYLYRSEHPVNWCPRCETAIAEAEVDYVEKEGMLLFIRFEVDNQGLLIATSRPELLPACVAVAVNPKDHRYLHFVEKEIEVPLLGRKVRILADESVDVNFGTGVVMVCTFGDKTDVKWQKKYNLPIVRLVSEDGRMTEEAGVYQGLTLEECRTRVVQDLQQNNLLKKTEKIIRNVGTCWRCHTPVEIISRMQWFMKTRDMTSDVVDWSEKVKWVPSFAKERMVNWATSLDWDWVISRQRIFATPIPVWYCQRCDETIVAEEDWLPVDPRFTRPRREACPGCGSNELRGETDVMDTWMDSSITCAVHAGWPDSDDLFNRLFPSDLQPNGLDIIRTWDYYLMVKHLALFGKAPYRTLLINGMVRGTDGRMMHKSFGNYVESSEAIRKHGADSLRQWAAAGAVTGYDIPFRWSDVEHGRRFLMKLWNAARLVTINLQDYDGAEGELQLLDLWLLSKLHRLISEVTDAFENFQFNTALESTRNFTWHIFCDQYLEAVKHRVYSEEKEDAQSRKAAQYVLHHTLLCLIRLLAPICPHITETIYKDVLRGECRSVHLTTWPRSNPRWIDSKIEHEGDALIGIISETRRFKSEKRLSLKANLKRLVVYADGSTLEFVRRNGETIRTTCGVKMLELRSVSDRSRGRPVAGLENVTLDFEV